MAAAAGHGAGVCCRVLLWPLFLGVADGKARSGEGGGGGGGERCMYSSLHHHDSAPRSISFVSCSHSVLLPARPSLIPASGFGISAPGLCLGHGRVLALGRRDRCLVPARWRWRLGPRGDFLHVFCGFASICVLCCACVLWFEGEWKMRAWRRWRCALSRYRCGSDEGFGLKMVREACSVVWVRKQFPIQSRRGSCEDQILGFKFYLPPRAANISSVARRRPSFFPSPSPRLFWPSPRFFWPPPHRRLFLSF